MQEKFTIQFSPTRLKQIKKIALSGSRVKLKILNGKATEGFLLLKKTAQKFKSFATDLADRIPQTLVTSDVVYIPIVAANQLVIDEVATCAKMIVQIGAKCLINYNAGGKLLIKF